MQTERVVVLCCYSYNRRMTAPTFRFGLNWQEFNKKYLNDDRVAMAQKSLTNFLGVADLQGKTFVDVGAGSGLYSLAALRLGAKEIVSLDVDADSVTCCQQLKEAAGNPANWKVLKASVLDAEAMRALGQFDVVYSWGVLHHTGNMWPAIENAMTLVKPGGVFFIAIYNKADGLALYPDMRFGPSSFWLWEKKFYVSLPAFLQNCIDYAVMSVLFVGYCLMLRNPFKVIRDHQDYFGKGMSWRINIKDWLGGYPYEVATVQEIFAFAKQRGFSLENLTCNNGLLNNEFLLKKVA